jgi:hypothetical protein
MKKAINFDDYLAQQSKKGGVEEKVKRKKHSGSVMSQ